MNETKSIYFYPDFKKISYISWRRIIQDLMSYHMICSDLEWFESMQDTYIEIKTYIDKNGILPDEAKEQSLIDIINLLKNQIEELKALDNNGSIKQEIKKLQNELQANEEELNFYLKYIKNNRFVYKHDKKGQQFFSRRKTALVIQEKMILNLIDDIKVSKRSVVKKLNAINKRIIKEITFENFDLVQLYKYIRPYIDLILRSEDFGYSFLQNNLYADY